MTDGKALAIKRRAWWFGKTAGLLFLSLLVSTMISAALSSSHIGSLFEIRLGSAKVNALGHAVFVCIVFAIMRRRLRLIHRYLGKAISTTKGVILISVACVLWFCLTGIIGIATTEAGLGSSGLKQHVKSVADSLDDTAWREADDDGDGYSNAEELNRTSAFSGVESA